MKVTFDHFPRTSRHLAAGFIGVAAIVLGGFGHPWVAIPLIGAMLLCLLLRNSIVFDLETRTYQAQHLFSTYRGTFSDLKGMEIDRYLPIDSQGQDTKHFVVNLVWVTPGGHPHRLILTTDFEAALSHAREAADQFGLPLIEGARLKTYRAEVERAHRDLLKL